MVKSFCFRMVVVAVIMGAILAICQLTIVITNAIPMWMMLAAIIVIANYGVLRIQKLLTTVI